MWEEGSGRQMELVSRWGLVVQSFECQVEKFGISFVGDGEIGKFLRGVWEQICILERRFRLQNGGWGCKGKVVGRVVRVGFGLGVEGDVSQEVFGLQYYLQCILQS